MGGEASFGELGEVGLGPALWPGQQHTGAADLLGRVDRNLGRRLRDLVDLKPASHYGESLLNVRDRTKAIRCARALVDNAADRTS
jgi:hypothetical protein